MILRTWATHVSQNNNVILSPGPANKFIGVYFGRLHTKDALDAQIGMVWSASFIDEIIDAGLREYG